MKDPHADLRERTKQFASRIMRLYVHLQEAHHSSAAVVIGKQLLRSDTSVAANHREAKYARSRADRIGKFYIILQELEESSLWLELLLEHNVTSALGLQQLIDEARELTSIFVASLHRLKTNTR